MRRFLLFIVCGLSLLPCASCGRQSPPAPPLLAISVAASTREAVDAIVSGFTFETKQRVEVNSGATSTLANQIIAGANADLFLSANREWADKIREAGHEAESVPLLTNRLVLAVARANPANIHQPSDLLNDQVQHVALAGENVPAGEYAAQALTKLNLYEPLQQRNRIVRGQDVRSALAFVTTGEADAAVVYATDALDRDDLLVVSDFDPSLHDEIVYVLVRLKKSSPHPQAEAFYRYLQSDEAMRVFVSMHFYRKSP